MEYIEAIKIKRRMLDATPQNQCDFKCYQCNFTKSNTGINIGCACFELFYPEEAEEILAEWNEENPLKTYLSVFLEAFPKAELDNRGIPGEVCPYNLGLEDKCQFLHTGINEDLCPNCWNRELVKNEN